MAKKDHPGTYFTIEIPFARKEKNESLEEFSANTGKNSIRKD
jgi:hypothetical protein